VIAIGSNTLINDIRIIALRVNIRLRYGLHVVRNRGRLSGKLTKTISSITGKFSTVRMHKGDWQMNVYT